MKRVMTAALALALLGGTSVLAAPQRDGDRGGGRFERGGGQSEGPRQGGGERPQMQRMERPEPRQEQRQNDRSSFRQGGDDGQRAQRPQQAEQAPRPQAVAPQQPQGGDRGFGRNVQERVQAQLQQRQPQPQVARPPADQPQAVQVRPFERSRPDAGQSQQRNGDRDRAQAGRDNRGPDARNDGRDGRNDRDGRWNGDGRNDRDGRGQDRNGRFDGRNGNDRWERNGPPRSRPPVVRPQDRWDRDRNRQRYDRNRWVFLIQPRTHYYWRGPTYYAPYDFYPRSWAYNQVLPWNWYTPDYYINDWAWYGLPMPPIGCEWVRLGDDAVLIDVFSGRVLSVVYSLFW